MPQDSDDAEASRRRRTTRHLWLSIGAFAVFALALAAVAWSTDSADPPADTSPAPAPTPSFPSSRQPTLLIQGTTAAGSPGNVLTSPGAVGEPGPALVGLPSDLVVSQASVPIVTMRESVSDFDTLLAPRAVAETLGVRVDAAWRLDRKALAGLVDAVGGMPVELTQRTRLRGEDGVLVLTIAPGEQRLTGVDASWYAVGGVSGEPETARTARFMAVLESVLRRIPADPMAVRELLTSLGTLAPSTIGTSDLADYLVAMGSALRSQPVWTFVIPATAVELGSRTWRWVDYRRAGPMLLRALPHAQWIAGADGLPRVLLLASAEPPGRIAAAAGRVREAGFLPVDGRGTPVLAVRRGRVLSREAQWAGRVSKALGLPARSVRTVPVDSAGPPWADVDVRLGIDHVAP